MRQRFRRLIVCPQSRVQIKIGLLMVKALRRWLEANELFAIVTGVVGALIAAVDAAGARRLSAGDALSFF